VHNVAICLRILNICIFFNYLKAIGYGWPINNVWFKEYVYSCPLGDVEKFPRAVSVVARAGDIINSCLPIDVVEKPTTKESFAACVQVPLYFKKYIYIYSLLYSEHTCIRLCFFFIFIFKQSLGSYTFKCCLLITDVCTYVYTYSCLRIVYLTIWIYVFIRLCTYM